MECYLADAQATESLGNKLAKCVRTGAVICLHGDLGAGKTTLVRGFLRGLGYRGRVKSPTYTLVEPYSFSELTVFHFDMYRLGDPEELEFIGVRDYFGPNSISLVEWPEKAAGWVPAPDIEVFLHYQEKARRAVIETKNSEIRACLAS